MRRRACLDRCDVGRLLRLVVQFVEVRSHDADGHEPILRGLCGLVEADVAVYWRGDSTGSRITSSGLDDHERSAVEAHLCDPPQSPKHPRSTERNGSCSGTYCDAETLQSKLQLATELGAFIGTMDDDGEEASHFLGIGRRFPASAFTPREAALVELFLIDAMIPHQRRRTDLTAASGSPRAPLSPRLREVLRSLLEGASEKEIARRLCRSPHTIHRYVVTLYRLFEVSSRAELLSRFIPAGRV